MGAIAFEWSACMTAVSRQPRREFVDFAAVPVSQWKMHDRLENWARWCHGRDNQSGVSDSPTFRLFKSDEWTAREYGGETVIEVNPRDAVLIAKGIAALPDKHRRALQWNYVRPKNPMGKARELGVSLAGLADLVIRGRFMLINRGV